MPPENTTPIDRDKMYFTQDGETFTPLGDIQEATLEPEVEEPPRRIVVRDPIGASFTATLIVPRGGIQNWLNYRRRFKKQLKTLHRLMHLGWHGKNRRIRKKNWRRAIALYQIIQP